ncbi:hypothetical protein AFCA_002060 [Aspergillus flavus]|uniref:Zn(2)-C6 fungal-type domain-containing protein n=1 Tax=Aspergillus flavus TaxID=5059 RepID=A0AB74BXI5_ASPFL|nr:hypothetical protein CA14_004902 [Aspergillus flavus]UCK59238.1 hypothetical protein AFCA_002060 [Aspergillus flavus]
MYATDTRLPSKRKRIITSCSECHRRKQKCDRKFPCNNCLARNVARKCVYNARQNSGQIADLTGVLGPEHGQDRAPVVPAGNAEGSGGLGYSLVNGSNAFVGLKEVLQDEDEFRQIITTHNRPFRSPVLKAHARTLISQLPSKPVLQQLADIFFAEVNWHYFILERFYFDDLFSRWQSTEMRPVDYLSNQELSIELQYFPVLLFQVVALSLQFLPPDALALTQLSSKELSSSYKYSELGDELVTMLGRHGVALTAVLADFLRASWLKNYGRGIEAWHSAGNAIRQAQELTLHRQHDVHQSSPDRIEQTLSVIWYDEFKKRVWMNLFVWDSLMAMILGRPRTIHPDDCDVKPPIDCNIPKDPSKTVPMTVQPGESPNGPTTVSAGLFRYALACKFHEMRALKADRPHLKDHNIIQGLHEQVVSLLENVPPYLRFKSPDTSWDGEYSFLPQLREEVFMTANLFLMTLHRPHILASAESRKAALEATLATLESQQRFFGQTSEHHYPLFGLAFYTIDASILLSIIVASYPPHGHEPRQYVYHVLQQAIERLSYVQPYNPIARSGLGIVQRCYEKLKEACHSPPNTSATPSSSVVSPRFELQSLRQELSHRNSVPANDVQSPPSPSSGPEYLDLLAPAPSMIPDSFSEAYWLDQLNLIQLSSAIGQDPDMFWDSLLFDRNIL